MKSATKQACLRKKHSAAEWSGSSSLACSVTRSAPMGRLPTLQQYSPTAESRPELRQLRCLCWAPQAFLADSRQGICSIISLPRVSLVMLLSICGGLTIIACAHSAAAGIAGAALVGFGTGSEADVTPYLLARYCGVRSFSLLYGCSWTAYAIGGAIGPVFVGKMFDAAGAYRPGSVLLLVIPCMIAAVMTLWLPRYRLRKETLRSELSEEAAIITAVAS